MAERNWKVIAPPENWEHPIEVSSYGIKVIGDVARNLGLAYKTDEENYKLYVGLPRIDEKYQAVFSMVLPTSSRSLLVPGKLTIYKGTKSLISVRASSGVRGAQYKGNYWHVGQSPVPPSNAIEGEYKMELTYSVPTSNVSALGSRFYHIHPDPIINKVNGGQRRTEVGLHYDENNSYSPGSAGCIVVLPKEGSAPGWNDMKALLDQLKSAGEKYLPLTVNYS